MLITGYRVRSLLRTYSERLQSLRLILAADGGEPDTVCGRKAIPGEARQRMALHLITSKVLEQAGSVRDKRGDNPE